ncbi:hypothetical protein EDF81_2903 [Enterobacter sp. BIGb0383]|nr:hypothetical protein EDF81_2903 [Enterobacter sp. BIGb0383]
MTITSMNSKWMIAMKKLLLITLLFSSPLFAKEITVGQVCKAAAASMFDRDHKTMKLDKVESGIAYVHYIRPVDNSRWAIKCKLMGDQVMWASDNPDSTGRWRDDPADSVVRFSVEGKKLTLSEIYSDGSSTTNTYPLKEL